MAKKDQFIVVCADSATTAEHLIPAAKVMASGLKKGIILLTCSADGKDWVGNFGVPYVALNGDWKTAIDGLPTAFNAVLAVTMADEKASRHSFTHPKEMLKNFKDCKVGYLVCCGQPLTDGWWPRKVALTLNDRRESKEKLIWASYFARFFGSLVAVMHHDYRDAGLRARWRNNMQYLDKLFGSLGVSYNTEMIVGSREFGNPDLRAIDNTQAEVFVSQVTDQRDRDLGDLLSRRPELKLIEKASGRPILFLNQRDDLYILCD